MLQLRPGLQIAAFFLLLSSFTSLGGCSFSAAPSADDILNGMSRIPDAGLIRDGMPTYIIMVEGMLSRKPDDPKLLKAASQLYGMYGTQFVDEESRSFTLTKQALLYAFQAADLSIKGFESARTKGFVDFEEFLVRTLLQDNDTLFFVGSAWLDYVRVRQDDLDSIADIPMIQLLLERVTALDPAFKGGMASLYLALLAATGDEGDTIVSQYFQEALQAGSSKNLMPEVFYATWLREKGEVKDGCQRLAAIVKTGIPENPEFQMYNKFALQQAQKELQGETCNESMHGEKGDE